MEIDQKSSLINEKFAKKFILVFPPFLFLIVSLIRLYPYNNTLFEDGLVNGVPVDDWGWYSKYALEIVNDGVVKINQPTGWFYGQFLAICFLIFGETNVPVFLIQSLLLGLSISLTYATFQSKMKLLNIKILFLILLITFGFLDVFKYYTFRCLSENLTLFLCALFLFTFITGLEKKKNSWQLFSACILGLICITRPNVFPFSIFVLIIYSFSTFSTSNFRKIGLFVVVFALTILLQPIGNYFLIDSFEFFPMNNFSFNKHAYFYTAFDANKSFRNFMSLFGFIPFTSADFRWRPHWTLMWILVIVFLINKLRAKQRFETWEIISFAFIFCYYFVIVFISDPDNGNYGFRFFLPALLTVIPFAVMAFEKLYLKMKSR